MLGAGITLRNRFHATSKIILEQSPKLPRVEFPQGRAGNVFSQRSIISYTHGMYCARFRLAELMHWSSSISPILPNARNFSQIQFEGVKGGDTIFRCILYSSNHALHCARFCSAKMTLWRDNSHDIHDYLKHGPRFPQAESQEPRVSIHSLGTCYAPLSMGSNKLSSF